MIISLCVTFLVAFVRILWLLVVPSALPERTAEI